MIDEFKRHYLAEIGSNYHGGEANLRQALEEGEYYPNLPATSYYAKMDALGYVWVARYHFPRELPLEWEVFDSVGVWHGTVVTPEGLEVHEIGRDAIIGVALDELGVAYVQVHDLNRR